jgi:hypothetical protein
MELGRRNGAQGAEPANPAHIVTVRNFSPETIRSIIAQLEVSSEFEHMVYREAELDALWSITGFFLTQELDSQQREELLRLNHGALQAHDLVAANRAGEAARALRSLL